MELIKWLKIKCLNNEKKPDWRSLDEPQSLYDSTNRIFKNKILNYNEKIRFRWLVQLQGLETYISFISNNLKYSNRGSYHVVYLVK